MCTSLCTPEITKGVIDPTSSVNIPCTLLQDMPFQSHHLCQLPGSLNSIHPRQPMPQLPLRMQHVSFL